MSDRRERVAGLSDHVTYGAGSVERLPRIVDDLDADTVLLVCGRRSFEASGASAMLPELEAVARVRLLNDVSPNTDVRDVTAGLEILREAAPDLVLGIGGGSAMDLAKLLCAYGGADARSVPERIRAGGRIEARTPRLVLVPTTSGSGSEATHFAVVYVGAEKFSVAGPAMLPDRVVLDPQLSRSGSPYQRATSGIDAICQAIESLWAAGATPESRSDARRALGLLLDHLEDFVADASSDAAGAVSLGSHLAGRAINVSKTTAAHALSYAITQRHGVSHGHAVALTLGGFLEAHTQADAADLQPGVDPREHGEAMEELLRLLDAADGAQARLRFVALLERLGLEPRPSRLGVTSEAERAALADAVNPERLGNNPARFDPAGLRSILEKAG